MQSQGVLFHIIFLNGPIASGKDTQAEILIEGDKKGVSISPGSIIREAREDINHPYRKLLEEHFGVLDTGELVPAETMVGIVANIINLERANGKETFVITGFPRSINYLNVLEPVLKKYEDEDGARVDFAYLHITSEESWKRTEGRIKEYAKNGLPPRPEDTPEKFEKRSMVFVRDTVPVMQYLMANDRCSKIMAMGNVGVTQANLKVGLRWEELHPPREGRLPANTRK